MQITKSCTLQFASRKFMTTRTPRMPAFWEYPRCPMVTHTIDSYWITSQNMTKSKLQIQRICQKFIFFLFWKKLYMRHPFWSCWIRCVNMKWIHHVLWKIQSGHDSVHRQTDGRTDGQGETSIPPFNFVRGWGGGIITWKVKWKWKHLIKGFITLIKVRSSITYLSNG